ncbi:IclR family transcriptional regulator [Gemmobacter fulvus]|uniref:IclR family transcriptional regulator n=1 Tax=Gemmobacter fulvus TaxID=2840474 RepID=UPI002796E046|nr:IclR family transcriptional regulator [Gemmobacter fulvus]MDQ1846860.1 IclR family transcriptional regulator [Gemmobacter fulvus]
MEREPNEKYRAPALDKGLDILELLSEQSDGLTRAEIVKAMGRGPSEIYRMLERLVARGYVARLSGGDRYALSIKLFVLANRHPAWRRLVATAQPMMDQFASETRQSCHLVIPDISAAVVIAQSSPMDSWEFRVRVGARLDLVGSGSGQTLLAFQDSTNFADLLATWSAGHMAEDALRLREEMEQVRSRGYRIAPSRQLIGVTDVSAPILNIDGQATAVITCAYIGRPAPAVLPSIEEVIRNLCEVAQRLSVQ